MDFEQVINSMTPDIYQRLVTAVELGKWPDGVALTAEQKENSLQLVTLDKRRGHSASPAFLSFLFYPPFHSLLTLDGLVAKICFFHTLICFY